MRVNGSKMYNAPYFNLHQLILLPCFFAKYLNTHSHLMLKVVLLMNFCLCLERGAKFIVQ